MLGYRLADIHGIVITHHHPDHAGLADKLRQASGAWIALHEQDAATARQVRQTLDRPGAFLDVELEGLRQAGTPDDIIRAFAATGGNGSLAALDWQPDREVHDGDLIDAPGRRLRVIWTPGHSPGHICLQLQDTGQLFTGDHVLSDTTPNIGLYADDPDDADPLGDYLDSIGIIERIHGVSSVLPAHEAPVDNLSQRLKTIRSHHTSRLDAMLRTFTKARTIWQAAERMPWGLAWDSMTPADYQLAIAEATAHVRYLSCRRLILDDGGSPTRFRVSA
jgi:glyoxylase-like metal-dependent hydrolase (beta-lactamase superfamily II)